ncbi:MAG TPA: AAA family ATPase [Oscillatoriaceae cyanobacterium M33_DOE_052]|uniref:Translation initiation factor IF-2 n=1 Tax=Planktothricoides sp. SpSt-374 TaxID=2282167 RepID=A0A7C3ZNP5_9CYAN|nr:AAA family ATPase [Oscillatoriaceae cyanobacterium M33_DOE_052]
MGEIATVEAKNNQIKVELNSNLAESLALGESPLPNNGFLFYEDVGSLVQIGWQETAVGNLREGRTHNLYLGNFFFDATQARPLPATTPLAKEDLLLSEANDSQIAAVEAVLAAEDLVLLQGPPGTGKTTVIAEICYQVALRGGRTLIASQANLAVDNALSRLTHHPVLRPLREGDAGSKVGREGAPFLAHRVIDRWLENTAADCEKRLSKQQEIFRGLRPILTSQEKFQDYVATETNFPLEYQTLRDRQTDLEATRENKQRDRESLVQQYQQVNQLKIALEGILESNSIFLAYLARKLQELREQQAEISTAHSELRVWKKNANDNIYRLLKQSWQQRVVTEELIDLPIRSRELAQKHQPDRLPWQEAGDRLLGEIRQLITQGQQWDEICQVANRIYWLIFQCQTTIAEQKPSDSHISQYAQQLKAKIDSDQPLSIINQLLKFARQIVQRISQSQSDQEIYRDAALLKAIEQQYKILIQENQPSDSEIKLNRMAAEYVAAVTTQIRSFLNQLDAETKQKIQQLELDVVNLNNTQSPFPVLEGSKNYLANRLDELAAHIEQMSQAIAELDHQINECTSRIQNLQDDFNSTRDWWRTTWNMIPSHLKPDTREPEIFTTDFLTTVPDNFEPWQEQLNQAESYLGRYERTMQEWIERLRHPSEEDIAAISKQYLDNVNVVGITCIKAAKWSFSERFSNFDVVIIDEVSKSTPPELLIPALKGKKVVMIGDYRQLPPILAEENLDELAEELSVPREKVEFLEESWFKQQFDAAANAQTGITRKLNVQYRMHPQIMEAINQFYDDGDGGLSCGLTEPDGQRAHNLQCSFLREDQHIAWIKMPNNDTYRENRHGTSYQNPKEVICIKKVCEHFNKLWEARVANGEPKKEIGIITFYGAQLRLIDEQINRGNQFPNLDIRTGTVDRFQGMEKPVIIVSMVRNNPHKVVGFAKTPERVNVAFSRAKELLVIVGCHQLFTTLPIYQQVSQVVQNYNGFINVSQLH